MAAPRKPQPTIRMAALYMPNGVHPDLWTPSSTGRDFILSPTLQPLTDLRTELLVLTNLWNRGSVGGRFRQSSISVRGTATRDAAGVIPKPGRADPTCHTVNSQQPNRPRECLSSCHVVMGMTTLYASFEALHAVNTPSEATTWANE
jgi:hypothetical protein